MLSQAGTSRRPRPPPPPRPRWSPRPAPAHRERVPDPVVGRRRRRPAASLWLSLTIATSYRPMRLLVPPPARTAYFSSTRRPGVVLRVSSTVRLVPASASAQARVCVATPDMRQSRFSAVRSAVSSGPRRSGHGGQHVARGRPASPSCDRASKRPRRHRADQVEDRGGDRQPGDHAVGPGDEVAGVVLVGRDGGHDGDVDAVRAPGPRRARSRRSGAPRPARSPAVPQLRPQWTALTRAHPVATSSSMRPSRADPGHAGGPATRAAASGKSSRQWQPRVSSAASRRRPARWPP